MSRVADAVMIGAMGAVTGVLSTPSALVVGTAYGLRAGSRLIRGKKWKMMHPDWLYSILFVRMLSDMGLYDYDAEKQKYHDARKVRHARDAAD